MTIEEVHKGEKLKRIHINVVAELDRNKFLIKDNSASSTLLVEDKHVSLVKVKMDLIVIRPQLVTENVISSKFPPSVRKPTIKFDDNENEEDKSDLAEEVFFGKTIRTIGRIKVYITGFFLDKNKKKAFKCRDQSGSPALFNLHDHMGPDFNLSSRGVHELVDTKIFSQKPGIVFMSATPRTKILCCDNNEELFRDVKVGEYQVQASLIDFTNFKQFHGGRFCVDMIFSIPDNEENDICIQFDEDHFSFSAAGDCDLEEQLQKMNDQMFDVQYDISRDEKNYGVKISKIDN